MYYLTINDSIYGHSETILPLTELVDDGLIPVTDNDVVEIWDDCKMVFRLARSYEKIDNDPAWRWVRPLRLVK